MSRPVQVSVEVPADVEAAWAAMTGPGWAPALDARLRDDSRMLSAEPVPDGGRVVVVSRRLPEGGPRFVRSLVPADGRVVQTDRWGPARDGARRATWSAEVSGTPATMLGEMALEPSPGGCRWTVRGTVSVQVALVGGKVEGFLAPLVEKLVVTQGEVLRGLV